MNPGNSTYSNLLNHRIIRDSNNLVLFCNYTAFDFHAKKYIFDTLILQNKLSGILLPEHGLFASKQDQAHIDSMTYRGVVCTSLYNKNESVGLSDILVNANAIIIDIQDVGVRYFTYTSHTFEILQSINKHAPDLPIFIIDRPNPIGKKVEGTIISESFASLLGYPGLIHRHGLSIGELCSWFADKHDIEFDFIQIPHAVNFNTYFIPPSPNLPSLNSLLVYPGQCLWEATTLSEGRGTTTPFELVGDPSMKMSVVHQIADKFNARFVHQAFVRPTTFIPTHHKHLDTTCHGWHLYIEDRLNYHTIFGTLYLMRLIKELNILHEFWLVGQYEFDSKNSAAQSLIGDDVLISFVEGEVDEEALSIHFNQHENAWRSSGK